MIDTRRTALYRALDADGVLLYVGISLSLGARLANHDSQSPWWGDIRQMTFAWFPSVDEARAAEREAIATERPLYNRRGGGTVNTPPSLHSIAAWPIRIERDKLERLREIAALEHRSLVQKLRVMIEREIADHSEIAA